MLVSQRLYGVYTFSPQGDHFIVTIRDVADSAGVSIATVSRVINGNYFVSGDLQTRVQKAMDELSYQPNTVARGLRRHKTQSIGVLIPKINDQFLSTLAYTIEKTLFDNHYRALLCSTEEALDRETEYIDSLLQQQVDGVIIFPREHSKDNILRLLKAKVAVIFVEREIPNLPVHRVLVDNYEGGYSAVKHLVELGHREIGLLMAYFDRFPISYRLQGALDALRDAGITPRQEHLRLLNSAGPRFEVGYQQGLEILDQKIRPTAIFAMTDELAIGAMHALTEHSVEVPKEMSIIGFDNIPLASFLIPPLTTVEQPATQIGETAGRMLLRLLEHDNPEIERVVLKTKLIVRKSTAPPIH